MTALESTLNGPLASSAIGPLLHSGGLDMALVAMLVLLLKRWCRGVHATLPWLFSLVSAATFHLLIPGSGYVVAGTVAGLVTAYLWARP